MADSNHIETVQDVLRDMRQWTDCTGFVERIEAALSIRALSPAGGDWVVVPREPTEEMRIAGERERLSRPTNMNPYHVWAAMLAASPQQEPGADGCGACGDSCANRGACRLADDSPTRLYALAAAIRGEADIADRPGQMARLNAIADELSVHSKPTPVDESWATINVNEIDSKSIADPSGQTLAGAGGDGHVAYQITEPGVRPCISAVIWNDETGKPGKGTHVWLTATSAGTTGDGEIPEIRKVAKRNLRSMIVRSNHSEKELMLRCLEELS